MKKQGFEWKFCDDNSLSLNIIEDHNLIQRKMNCATFRFFSPNSSLYRIDVSENGRDPVGSDICEVSFTASCR